VFPTLSEIWASFVAFIADIMAAVWSWVVGFVSTLLPSFVTDALPNLFSYINTPFTQYVAWLMGLDVLVPVTIGAYVTRYLLRRVP
jgi:amino acid permease